MTGSSQAARRGRRRWLFVPMLSALTGLSLVHAASPSQPANPTRQAVTCGQSVSSSIVVTSDLTDCPGTGLVVNANGITIDLGGNVIDGARTRDGIGIDVGSFRAVTIKNGSIRDFNIGVSSARGSMHLRLLSLRVYRSGDFGILLRARSSVIADSNVFLNTQGIYLSGDAFGSRITSNTATANSAYGIYVNAPRVVVSGNRALSNRAGGIFSISSNGVISDNIADSNDHNGITIPISTGAIFQRLSGNKAHFNIELGIAAAGGMHDLGGNRAGGNGDRRQCLNIVCS